MAAAPPPKANNPAWYDWANLSLGLLGTVITLAESLIGHLGNKPEHVQQLQELKDAHQKLAQNTPPPPAP